MALFRYFFAVLTLLAGLFATGMYLGFEGSVKGRSDFEANVSFRKGNEQDVQAERAAKPELEPAAPHAEVLKPESRLPKVSPKCGNITDRWISEKTNKSYFVHQVNDEIEIFENDDRRQRLQTGDGTRTESDIAVQFYSRLDEVNGTLELTISKDCKSMLGEFTPMDDRTPPGTIHLFRSTL